MSSVIVVLAAALSMTAVEDPRLLAGNRYIYRGGVAPLERDRTAGERQKTFELAVLAADVSERASKLYWLVEERGQGGWTWSERFGEWSIDAQGRPTRAAGPSLRFQYGPEGSSVVPLLSPVWPADFPLQEGATWKRDNLEYEVAGQERREGLETWRVNVRSDFGPKRSVWIEPASRTVVAIEEVVFMNQGAEYQVDYKLTAVETPDQAEFDVTRDTFAALVELRARLNRPARQDDAEWTGEQRAVLVEGLPAIEKLATPGPLGKLVRAAAKDISYQAGRAKDVEELAQRYVGQSVESFSVEALSGKGLGSDDLVGKVTVLHFWDYKDSPLSEPYGQVGYLEFLSSRRQGEGVAVYGVAVNARLDEEKNRGAVKAGVRKLRSFMNLSYSQLLDNGDLLKKFGDPRTVGASLPLFVVIGADGKIREYHVGFYKVDDRQGLKELDVAVGAAIKARDAAQGK